jgi:hypothetical protein
MLPVVGAVARQLVQHPELAEWRARTGVAAVSLEC